LGQTGWRVGKWTRVAINRFDAAGRVAVTSALRLPEAFSLLRLP